VSQRARRRVRLLAGAAARNAVGDASFHSYPCYGREHDAWLSLPTDLVTESVCV